jgi:hypothetical protein
VPASHRQKKTASIPEAADALETEIQDDAGRWFRRHSADDAFALPNGIPRIKDVLIIKQERTQGKEARPQRRAENGVFDMPGRAMRPGVARSFATGESGQPEPDRRIAGTR